MAEKISGARSGGLTSLNDVPVSGPARPAGARLRPQNKGATLTPARPSNYTPGPHDSQKLTR